MQSREKKLLLAVAVLVGLIVVVMLGKRLVSASTSRFDTIARLNSHIAGQRIRRKQAEIAIQRQKENESRSLPRDVATARTRYQDWLFKRLAEAGFKPPHDVTAKPIDPRGDLRRLPFDVKVRGTLDQFIRFLYGFYHADHLHQIRRLIVTRVEKTTEIELDIGIEALSLPEAARQSDLNTADSRVLKKSDLQAYLSLIKNRNVIGPPNRPPVL